MQWETPTNWNPEGEPDAASLCTIDNGNIVDLSEAGELAYGIELGETKATTLNVSGDLTVSDAVNVHANGTLNVNGTLSAAEVICDGTLSGADGTIEADYIEIAGVVSPGVVSPGSSVGTLNVDGELELIEGTYLCEIDSTGADLIHNANQDEAIILGEEQQGGTLELLVLEGWAAPGCYTETILSTSGAGVIEGDFAVKPAEGYLDFGVFLEAYEVPDPAIAYTLSLFQAGQGDTDGDGDVDLDDLSALDDGWDPAATDKTWPDGDFDFDGDVDLNDLSALDDNWNPGGYPVVDCPFAGGGAGAGAVAVPEPSTLLLLGMGAICLLAYAWRRRRCR